MQVGSFWYADEKYGPPLPHSMWLWDSWGCYEHEGCVATVDFFRFKKGEREKLIHHSLYEIALEAEKHATTCECWMHWLLGQYEEPGHAHGDDFYYVGY